MRGLNVLLITVAAALPSCAGARAILTARAAAGHARCSIHASSRRQTSADAYLEGQSVIEELMRKRDLQPKFVAVTLSKPLGVTFAQNPGGKGVYVANLDEGSQRRLAGVCLGDWLISVRSRDVTRESLDTVLAELEDAPLFVSLGLQRGGSEPWRAADGLSAEEMLSAVLAQYEGSISASEQAELFRAFEAFKEAEDELDGGSGPAQAAQAQAGIDEELVSSSARAVSKAAFELRSFISVRLCCPPLSFCGHAAAAWPSSGCRPFSHCSPAVLVDLAFALLFS